MMKRTLSMLLSVMLVLGLFGGAAVAETPDDTAAEAATKTLIVYFSATNNTENVANIIAAQTGADLFELLPVVPYTDEDLDWTDENSRASVEHANPDAQAVELVSTVPENWESYDTVYIGYPIWWRAPSWVLHPFIEANDFTGKTVIPFGTSSASGLREDAIMLADLAGEGKWLEDTRFPSSVDEAEVIEWLNGLDFSKAVEVTAD